MEATPNIVKDVLPISTFLTDWHTRVTWIGFLTLWVFWGASWVIRNAFGGDSSTTIQSNAQISSNYNGQGDPEVGNTTNQGHKQLLAAPAWSVNVFNRLNRAHDMLRDLVLMLLSVLTLNTFARASLRGVMIVTWLYVAFAVVYFVVEASYEHRYLRLLYTLTFYTLGLAIAGLAYKNGFYGDGESTNAYRDGTYE
ncbi:uncharacterized protein EV154DRAFT_598192 [Mucor mucedo]|uniref:uncharacterized protein n=1 Tax=Mucor mucedo TaxID=29922 RepID=UPI002220AF01|nr:uncharacterized protein EV154DRAFT_598192 [Mucor mucedo]KAI7896572.1 hypothetical protein EV154DRAFT_598192 [Mucor mucedo]